MINIPWIHPASIDYTDASNPLRLRAWNSVNNRYMYDTLNDPVWQGLRNAKNLEPRLLTAPTQLDQLMDPLSTYDQSLSIDPNTWLYGINGAAQAPAGFYCQITDALTGATLWSQPIHSRDILATPARGVICYLAAPRLFVPPSYPIVRIQNLAATPAFCMLTLFCATELPEPDNLVDYQFRPTIQWPTA
jgi:hypothetical protein